MSRKTTANLNRLENYALTLARMKFGKEILSNFVDINTLSLHNLVDLINSITDAYTKSSLPKNMHRNYGPRDNHIEGVTTIGQYYPINVQQIQPQDYSYKPFGNNVLDFDPVTGEFVTYPISEWRSKTDWDAGNTKKELLNYVPMGLELEIIYRGKGKQCDDCFYEDDSNENPPETYCEDDYCYSDNNFDLPKAQKEMFKFLAQLNLSFGAIGTKSDAVWICKNDSSVDLEFVSMPMTIRAFKAGFIIAKQKFNAFEKVAKYAKAYYGPCGGHIHIDKDSFTNTYQYYAFLSMHYDNPEFIAAIAQRSVGQDNQWAYLYKPNDFAKVVKYKWNSQSRQAVNVTDMTVELRYFRSNLKVDRLLKNFEFIQAMYTFTSAMTYQDLAKFKQNTLKYFLLYVRANRHNYPNLFNFLVIRKWIKNEKLIDTKIFPTIAGAFYEDSIVRAYQEDANFLDDNEAVARLMSMLFNEDENGGEDNVYNRIDS